MRNIIPPDPPGAGNVYLNHGWMQRYNEAGAVSLPPPSALARVTKRTTNYHTPGTPRRIVPQSAMLKVLATGWFTAAEMMDEMDLSASTIQSRFRRFLADGLVARRARDMTGAGGRQGASKARFEYRAVSKVEERNGDL